jgi:hypothetical protein
MQGSHYYLFDEDTNEEIEIDQDHYYRLWLSMQKHPERHQGIKIRKECPKVIMVPNCLVTK